MPGGDSVPDKVGSGEVIPVPRSAADEVDVSVLAAVMDDDGKEASDSSSIRLPDVASEAVEAAPSADSDLLSSSTGVPALLAAFAFPFLAPVNNSRGKSPTAIAMLPMSPTRADVTAEMGSQG